MNSHLLKRVLSMVLVLAMLAGVMPPLQASADVIWEESDIQITPDRSENLVPDDLIEPTHKDTDNVRVSIVLEDKPTIQAGFATKNIGQNASAMAYNRQLRSQQDVMAQTISTKVLNGQKLDVVWNLTLVGNLISANVPYGKIDAIENMPGVKSVIIETSYAPCVANRDQVAQPQMYGSLGMAGSSLVWTNGYTGAGSRIAVIDTGSDTDHQSLDADAFIYALEQNAEAEGLEHYTYINSLNLLDAAEIASVLSELNISEGSYGFKGTAAQLYINEKLPFGFNYIDRSLDVTHDHDGQGEHGSHVAGIATANRYIPDGNEFVDALDSVLTAGMAPDAQLITMKVFGQAGGAYDSDYMAAIEDAILLNCDAVNLSLGSANPGVTYSDTYGDLLDYLSTTDTVVVGSAGNSYSWADATTNGYLYSDGASLDTVGSPGSLSNFLAVASVDNSGGVGNYFTVAGKRHMYTDTGNEYRIASLVSLDHSATGSNTGTEYEYIFVDGMGDANSFAGMDLDGKIAFCSRGNTSFYEKADTATGLGAVATIIYNNAPGQFSMNLTGLVSNRPCVSISQESANAIRNASTKNTTSAGLTYYTGKITITRSVGGFSVDSTYHTMSDFSSWGVPGDLSIKPEITAPGGSIYSIYGSNAVNGGGSDKYEIMSGTSMAAPAVTGIVALLAQYFRENDTAFGDLNPRTLAQSLLMSTAVPLLNSENEYYHSILKQGAGLARADLATAAHSYIMVNGQADGKVKAELGDDPSRTGVYSFSFTLNNLTDTVQEYAFRADMFRQSAFNAGNNMTLMDYITTILPGTATFTVNGKVIEPEADLSGYDMNGDGKTDETDADYLLEYLLGNETQLHADGDVSGDSKVDTYDAHALLNLLSNAGGVKLPAGGKVTVNVTLKLTANAKAQLEQLFPNGTYVQAYVYAEELSSDEGVKGTVHSIPTLAFYGSWTDPSMYDLGSYHEYSAGMENRMPYLYNLNGNLGNFLTMDYGNGGEYFFGANPVSGEYTSNFEANSLNNTSGAYLKNQYFALIRNASDSKLLITNHDTGEVYVDQNLGSFDGAYYFVNAQVWEETQQRLALNWRGTDSQGNALPEGTTVDVSLVAIPEYYRNADGSHDFSKAAEGAYLTTQVTIDNTAPQIVDAKQDDDNKNILVITANDNHYLAGAELYSSNGSTLLANTVAEDAAPGKSTELKIDLSTLSGTKDYVLAVYDYAANMRIYTITLELDELDRPYFTAVNYTDNAYVAFEKDTDPITLASINRGEIRAAEYVDGVVFEINDKNELHYAFDYDLNTFKFLCELDPSDQYQITYFADLAYNKVDGKLYGLFFSMINDQNVPYLCSIDIFSGQMTVLDTMPKKVNNLAIDGKGNFYSVPTNRPDLYTYTLTSLASGNMTLVGLASYCTEGFNSLTWDHNTDSLYWAYPKTSSQTYILKLNPTTGAASVEFTVSQRLVGLYIRSESVGNTFTPSNTVSSVRLNHSNITLYSGSELQLKATVSPWTVNDSTVTWSSSDTSIASVDQNGLVKTLKDGTAVITATSNLDSTKFANCTLTIHPMKRELKGLIWDEYGEICWSKFSIDDPSNYTEINKVTQPVNLTTTAWIGNTLYAGSLTNTSTSDLYIVNPSNWEMTQVGGSDIICYTDLAYSPSLGCLIATYFNYIALVDPATGEYFGAWNWATGNIDNLVGITYYGSDTTGKIDYFLLLDAQGNTYLEGFTYENDQAVILIGPNDAFIRNIGPAVDYDYFQGFYYDGTFAYWTRFCEDENDVDLIVWDCDKTNNVYNRGSFPAGIWPVSGLYSDFSQMVMYNADSALASRCKAATTAEAMQIPLETNITPVETKVSSKTGSTNAVTASVQRPAAPLSAGEVAESNDTVTVKLTAAEAATNGRMTVSYDASQLKLTSVTGTTPAFAYAETSGAVEVAFADLEKLGAEDTVATLVFQVITPAEHTITVSHSEVNNTASDKVETVKVSTLTDSSTDSGATYNVRLIEPWALRVNVRFKDSSGNTIDVATMQDYGAYAVRGSLLSSTENVTLEQIIADSDTIHFAKGTEASGGMFPTGDGRATFHFFDDLFTYRLSEEVYWVAYYKDAEGNTYFTKVRNKSLNTLMHDMISKVSVSEAEVYEWMLEMEESILAYRNGRTSDAVVEDAKTVATCGINFGQHSGSKYGFGRTYRISLIEPWGVMLNTRIHDTTDANTASDDHIDYASADNYGVIVYHDKTGTLTGMDDYTDLLALDNAYVYSKDQGNVSIDGNKISVAYNRDIYTYELNSNIYCVTFVEVDGQYYYSTMITRNLYELMGTRISQAGANVDAEIEVYIAMRGMYDSVTEYRSGR